MLIVTAKVKLQDGKAEEFIEAVRVMQASGDEGSRSGSIQPAPLCERSK